MVILPSFPLSFEDISLWLALTAVILLVTSEVLLPQSTKTLIHINQKRLEKTAIAVSILFLITILVTIVRLVSVTR